MRRRLLLPTALALITLVLPACSRFAGPLESNPRNTGRVDQRERGADGEFRPLYSIDEQQARGRERLSITEDDFRIGPKGYIDRPSPIGR
jgi:hypothetical protein